MTSSLCIAGKNDIAIALLEHALSVAPALPIYALVNRTDAGEDGWQRSFRKRAHELAVPVMDLEAVERIPGLLFLSLEYDRLVKPQRFLDARLYNLHFSLLPRYKGMYTSAWPILNSERLSGVSLHEIDAGIDTGAIVAQAAFALADDLTCEALYWDYLKHGTALALAAFDDLLAGTVTAYPQAAEQASYYSRHSLDYHALPIDLNKTAVEIKRQIQAFAHRRYQLPKVHGQSIVRARITGRASNARPGTIQEQSADSLCIATVDYDLCLYVDRLDELLLACERGDAERVASWLDNLCFIDEKNARGWSPLIVAAYHGQMAIVELLLAHGANVNDHNFKGTSVLMYAKEAALRDADTELLKVLLAWGADPSWRDYSGRRVADYLNHDQARQLGLL